MIKYSKPGHVDSGLVPPGGMAGFWTSKLPTSRGNINAPATFERRDDRVLCGMRWSRCLVYLDDVISFGKSVRKLSGVWKKYWPDYVIMDCN